MSWFLYIPEPSVDHTVCEEEREADNRRVPHQFLRLKNYEIDEQETEDTVSLNKYHKEVQEGTGDADNQGFT